ncbi:LPS biosynthesis protein, partial [bacterium]|nr:LPS biosynthesis protein [bacterium]
MKALLVTQARYGSSRFPGKILKKIGNKTLLQIHLERLKRSKKVQHFMVATTQEPEAASIVEIARMAGFDTY